MIYTIDRNTNVIVMISESPNDYDNPDWFDLETDEEYQEWLETHSGEETIIYDEATDTVTISE